MHRSGNILKINCQSKRMNNKSCDQVHWTRNSIYGMNPFIIDKNNSIKYKNSHSLNCSIHRQLFWENLISAWLWTCLLQSRNMTTWLLKNNIRIGENESEREMLFGIWRSFLDVLSLCGLEIEKQTGFDIVLFTTRYISQQSCTELRQGYCFIFFKILYRY